MNAATWRAPFSKNAICLVRFNCLLLLLCGDILPNPGPLPRYPCGVCQHAVRPSDKALLYDSYDKWFHVECTRVSSEEYDHYITLDQFDWSCLLCLFDVLPPDDVCDSHIISTLSNVHSVDSNESLLLPSAMFKESITADLCVVHHNV